MLMNEVEIRGRVKERESERGGSMYNRDWSRPVQSKLLELPNFAKIVNVLYNRSKLRPMQRQF